jgi:hypothetical protein
MIKKQGMKQGMALQITVGNLCQFKKCPRINPPAPFVFFGWADDSSESC